MIVPMKKAVLVTTIASKDIFLEKLRALGMLHLSSRAVQSKGLVQALEQKQRFEEAINFLAEYDDPKNHSPSLGQPEDLVDEAFNLRDQLNEIQESTAILKKALSEQEKWGEYSLQDLKDLAHKGYYLTLYSAKIDQAKDLEDLEDIIILKKDKLGIAFVAFSRSPEPLKTFTVLPWPEKSLSQIQLEITHWGVQHRDVVNRLKNLGGSLSLLKDHDPILQQTVEWETAQVSAQSEGNLVLFEGYIPVDQVDPLRSWASNHQAGLLLQDPTNVEEVPTLVKTPKWLNAIKPVFQFLGIVPGYKELDISFFFLIFFSLFFAMIIGDGGYGALFTVGTLTGILVLKAKGKKAPILLILGLILGLTTMVWGAITGSWFGTDLIVKNVPFLKNLVIPQLDTFKDTSGKSVILLSFILGLTHLTIAQIWNILRALADKPRIRVFAQIGWLGMNFALFNLVLNMVLDKNAYPIQDWVLPVVLGGLGLVIIFGSQEGKFLKGLGAGLGNILPTTLNVVSAFGDIISYIRLFAVGLAGFKIAESFNAMAAGFFGPDSGLMIFFGILILFLGHTLNLVLALLGVLVHGIRLNILEFSGRLGLEWSGQDYNPFKLRHRNSIKNKEKQGESYGS